MRSRIASQVDFSKADPNLFESMPREVVSSVWDDVRVRIEERLACTFSGNVFAPPNGFIKSTIRRRCDA